MHYKYFYKSNQLLDSGKKLVAFCIRIDGYHFKDFQHSEWEIVCENPDADELVFSEPRFLFHGFLRCKPLVMANGAYMYCNYNQLCDRYAYSLSYDKGKTFTSYYGGKKINTPYDETMAYQTDDLTVRMLARTSKGFIAESVSTDNALTFSDGKPTDILNPNSRFYVAKLPSGRVLLINNDHERTKAKEIILCKFTEEDIINNTKIAEQIISKAYGSND